MISSNIIEFFFQTLNENEINYVLIKNICNELPNQLPNGKDIDIVVNLNDIDKFHLLMNTNYVMVKHPLGIESGWQYLYGLKPFEFWKLKDYEKDLYIDVSFSLACNSLMPKTWIPLDKKIQQRMWREKRWDPQNRWWIIDPETQFLYKLVRCIFDKKTFSEKYIKEIEGDLDTVNWAIVSELLDCVFFKYKSRLMQLINEKNYNKIREDYIMFSDY